MDQPGGIRGIPSHFSPARHDWSAPLSKMPAGREEIDAYLQTTPSFNETKRSTKETSRKHLGRQTGFLKPPTIGLFNTMA
jgi:hypothetical protein